MESKIVGQRQNKNNKNAAYMGFPGSSVVENLPTSAGDATDMHSIPGLGRSVEGNGNPLQYYCLENSMDSGA